MHDHTLQERNPAIWSQQNRKTGTQNTFVLSVKPSVFKGCRGRAIFYYPIWWGIAAWPVSTFVQANDFAGKTVIPFCTSSSSGLGESGALLAELAGTGEWLEGVRFSSRVTEEDVQEWLASLAP